MEVKRISDIAAVRRLEYLESKAAEQAGMLEYIACMSDVELPEDETEQMGGPQDE